MKLAVIGSRRFNNYQLLKSILTEIKSKIEMILSGGALGADSLAMKFAKENNIAFLEFPPDFSKYKKEAK